ncbi:MAG: hypothetical protein Q7U75_13585 [Desulfobacterales bacterium]|nr:hypothetical protein [Desulfobacterales bacterium]
MAKKNEHLRVAAIRMRTVGRMSLDEIVARLQQPRGTVYYWIRDIPLQRDSRSHPASMAARAKANESRRKKAKGRRDDAYNQFAAEVPTLIERPMVRDFAVVFLTEGYRKGKNSVVVANTNPNILSVVVAFAREFSEKPVRLSIQYYRDQDVASLVRFWSERLSVEPQYIRTSPKGNAGGLRVRGWANTHGVAAVLIHDTYLRCRVQALTDYLEDLWAAAG